jgi:hypothetical protein
MIMDLISQLETSETDSILDCGLLKFEHREKFRGFSELSGCEMKTHFLEISKGIRPNKGIKRNSEKGETFGFLVPKEDFYFIESWF